MPSSHRPDADAPGDYVTVARRFDPIAAELLRGRLAADGIPARLADAHLVQTYTLWAAALGGVRVMVPAWWAPQALRAITAIEQGDLALEETGPFADFPDSDPHAAEGAPATKRADARYGLYLAAGSATLLLLLAAVTALGAEPASACEVNPPLPDYAR